MGITVNMPTGGVLGLFLALNAVAMIQAFYLANCRSLRQSILAIGLVRNGWLWPGIAGVLLLQAGLTYLPFLKTAFQAVPIGWDEWPRILAGGAAVLVLVEVQKWTQRLRKTAP
jgi:hypothetical protein